MNICIVSNHKILRLSPKNITNVSLENTNKTTMVTCELMSNKCVKFDWEVSVFNVEHMGRVKFAQLSSQEKLKWWRQLSYSVCVCVHMRVRVYVRMWDEERESGRGKESIHLCVVWSWLCLQLSTSVLWYNPPGRHSCTDTWRESSRGAGGNGVITLVIRVQTDQWSISLKHVSKPKN